MFISRQICFVAYSHFSMDILLNMLIDIVLLKWWHSSNTASMYFHYCLHKSSTVRGSAVLSVLLLLACFVISVRLIIPLYSHYRDQAPIQPQLGDHWPMGAQWGQSHTAAWLMAGTQPWRGNAHMRRLLQMVVSLLWQSILLLYFSIEVLCNFWIWSLPKLKLCKMWWTTICKRANITGECH